MNTMCYEWIYGKACHFWFPSMAKYDFRGLLNMQMRWQAVNESFWDDHLEQGHDWSMRLIMKNVQATISNVFQRWTISPILICNSTLFPTHTPPPTPTAMAAKPVDPWNTCLNTTLEEEDKEVFAIVENEKLRQWSGLELIASEVWGREKRIWHGNMQVPNN